ncbi:phosphatases II [Basidiobolus meristosporus CBS 931.73]|uniref:protein-tyrosine-phosphatase n=1 Tax=Basidiobolus meristosporus CBS 931.73 TaxID=1314790 RepID=A0A1Y1Y637_9FUNG|nr:phosphatases II [Basidiobolus meristosporus CBS 931.73]|eukprot:ORX93355.1 phosphatases II [Basidiobolus meristosporus CBS 931.73]
MPAELRTKPQQPKASVLDALVSFIEYKDLRFLILDCPTNSNIQIYLREFHHYLVTDVVRVCEPTYSTEPLINAGIAIHDLPFPDGSIPSSMIIKKWLNLVDSCGKRNRQGETNTIAIHCVAGLGRAPVLVALALIESGMESLNAIEFIRAKRRGAFNNRQIEYLDSYKRTKPAVSFKKSLNRMFKFTRKTGVV